MRKVAVMDTESRRELFLATAAVRNIAPIAIEKDFWVCFVLNELFSSEFLRSKLMFKGGTSLSKVYGIIERFSEDIDLVLNWNEILDDDPNAPRSKNKQDKYNKKMDVASQAYVAHIILPEVEKLIGHVCSQEIFEKEPDSIQITYPSSFSSEYISPRIKLEIGAKASWVPNRSYTITSYAAEEFPEVFQNAVFTVNVVCARRTFWEKATILHQEAHRPADKIQPAGYSRHYYDLIKLNASPVKENAMNDLQLLKDVVEFKQRFYSTPWARYDLAIPPTFRLVPEEDVRQLLLKDYKGMQEMFFSEIPSFDEILFKLSELEIEINTIEGYR
ncbi:MAG: nucleotidyl transferase AbiEii/AbiGii toxin family protein [Candidatus Sabulitectum sp.]|nr:nucleotidyl transferase AbiEii/AbiGii toxin family protein [Candidatus Sabulitectum sp.]